MHQPSSSTEEYAKQALLFSRYLISRTPVIKVEELYIHAMRAASQHVSARDRRLLAFIARHPWAVGFVDAGLSIVDPDSEVRRRIYVTLSILETMPNYADAFLPKERSFWYIGALLYTAMRGVLRSAVGVLLVKVVA
jgi:hypothetical protein